jgi:nitrogen permease regulator 2-like protein
MPSNGDSFFPRIKSVFYAVFDVEKGPKIIYQVPDGLIGVSSAGPSGSTSFPSTPFPSDTDPSPTGSQSASIASPSSQKPHSRSIPSPQKLAVESSQVLFDFDDISKYVIPRSALCGRLVICATGNYRIIGFPVELRGEYKRNYIRYNLCFVFERSADLSCYEPIVRKVSRVLSCCEVRSNVLVELLVLNCPISGGISFLVVLYYFPGSTLYSRAIVRGSELIFRNSSPHRRIQLNRLEDLSLLS